jgi:hypothetical protein
MKASWEYLGENEEQNEELLNEIFYKTNTHLDTLKEKFSNELFGKLSFDIEKWLKERLDNVYNRMFRNITDFFLGKSHTDDEKKLSEWLLGLGHDQESFRNEIRELNDKLKDIVE